MGNFFKNFALNKTTVTILGIIASAVVLIVGYTYRTNTNVSYETVYYVSEKVPSNKQLSELVIKKTRVNSKLVSQNSDLVTNLREIKDKNGEFYYVNYGHTLTQGALLTKSALIAKENKSDEKLYLNLKENQTIFKINVDIDSTSGNSIQKGNAIDIYIDGKESRDVIYGPFIENLKVIDVVDNKWNTTKDSSSSESNSAPRYLITAVDEDMFQLLSKVILIKEYEFKLVPVDTRKAYVENSEPRIVNQSIKNIVDARTAYTN